MKKQISIAALVFGAVIFGTANVQAQVAVPAVATTNVNIILADVISIDSGVAIGGVVDFNYTTSQDYNNSKTVTVPNSLVVTSSKNFNVKVKADGANFVKGTDLIPVDVLRIKAVAGGTMVGTMNEVVLSTTDQNLVTTATKGAQKSLTIEYTISATKAQNELLGKPAGTYKQTVTYTATAI